MKPLSCVNCCHNPLQLGAIGPSFGYCTRHRLVLSQPHLTTCGQLLRKDLLATAAGKQQVLHAQTFPRDRVSVLASPKTDAANRAMTEKPNGKLPGDAVFEEVKTYGDLDSRIATMAALRRVPGPRAEVAMLSLSRAYISNCYARGGQWTAGVHLAYWTINRLSTAPAFETTDLHGPFVDSLHRTTALASWTLVMFRLALLSDVSERARAEQDRAMARIGELVLRVIEVSPTRPDELLSRLHRDRARWNAVLTDERYAALRASLHRDPEDDVRASPPRRAAVRRTSN